VRDALIGLAMGWVAIDADGALAMGIFGPALAMALGALDTGFAATFVWIFCFWVRLAGFFTAEGLRARLFGKVVVGAAGRDGAGLGAAGATGEPADGTTGSVGAAGLAESDEEGELLPASTEGSGGFGPSLLAASLFA
jgi:hypothetical protein